jgi:hypothetical protein
MHDKVFVLIAYALLGITLALMPVWVARWTARTEGADTPMGVAGSVEKGGSLFLLAGLVLAVSRGWIGGGFALALVVTAFIALRVGRALSLRSGLACVLALYVTTALPWWKVATLSAELPSLLWLCGMVIVFSAVFVRESTGAKQSFGFLIAGYALIVLLFSFSTGIVSDDGGLLTLWHHWGAYIGPAEAMLSGAAILRDVPLQYGLGPTLLIGSTCGGDCWYSMYFIAGTAIFLFALGLGAMAMALSWGNRWQCLLALACCFASIFLWTAYPPEVSTPLITPSTTGLRFLPAVVLACYLFFVPAVEASRTRTLYAHLLWGVGALWSPESAFYVTFIWWPYYLWRQTVAVRSAWLRAGCRALGKLFVNALGLMVVFVVVYRVIYGVSPSLYGYLAYAINPPGPMPINPHGTVLYFLMATLLAALAIYGQLKTSKDSVLIQRGFVVQLLCYSAASYFLGRSHDNNVLNVLPFIALSLLYAQRALPNGILRHASIVMMAAVIGWLPLFGWGSWQHALSINSLLTFRGTTLGQLLTWENQETTARIERRFGQYRLDAGSPADAGAALNWIRREYAEPATVLDFAMNLPHSAPNTAWSAIHGPANFPYIPSERRRQFIALSAERLKRAGWLVVDRKFPADEWLADFATAYRIAEKKDFGSYYALRMVPFAASENH